MSMDAKSIRNEGKDIAQHFRVFRCGYRIIKDPTRGVLIAGASPDGRYTGTCDRCGTAILNVSCFASDDPERPGFMHVGIDCAQRMGVPLSELRKARTFVKNHERSKRREAAAKGKETRDGLVSTQVNRPRKSTEHSRIDSHGTDLSDEAG